MAEPVLPLLPTLQIMKEDDTNWPAPDRVGRQELEVMIGDEHIAFATTKLGSLLQVQSSNDPEGLRVFYYLVQVGGGRGAAGRRRVACGDENRSGGRLLLAARPHAPA